MPTFDEIPAQMTVEPVPAAPSADVVNLEPASEPDAIEQPDGIGEAEAVDEAEAIDEAEAPVEVEPPTEPGHGGELAEAPPEPTAVDVAEEPQLAAAEPAPDEDLWEEAQPKPEPRVKPPSRPSAPGELPERRVVVLDEHPDIDIEAGKEAPPRPPGPPEHGMTDIGETLDDDKGRKRRWRMFRKGGDR